MIGMCDASTVFLTTFGAASLQFPVQCIRKKSAKKYLMPVLVGDIMCVLYGAGICGTSHFLLPSPFCNDTVRDPYVRTCDCYILLW